MYRVGTGSTVRIFSGAPDRNPEHRTGPRVKDRALEQAAADPEYRNAVQQVSAEWAAADAQGLPDD